MSEIIEVLAGLAFLALSAAIFLVLPIGLILGAVQWTLGPLMQVARTTKTPSSFLLSDLAWLLVHMQLAMALAMYAFPHALETRVRVMGLFLWCLPGALLWAASLHLVSQAGITRPLRRALVFLVVVPGMATIVCCAPLLAIQLLQGLGPTELMSMAGPSLAAIGGQFAALAAFALAVRLLARWATAGQ
jgi:hypothetical protein